MKNYEIKTIEKIIKDYNGVCENIKLSIFAEGEKKYILNDITHTIEKYSNPDERIRTVLIYGSRVISFESDYHNTRFAYFFRCSFDSSIKTEIFEDLKKYCEDKDIRFTYYNDF